MAAGLEQTKAAALTILGKGAKIPEPRINIHKLSADFNKAKSDYYAAVNTLQTKILAMQNTISTAKNAYKQYQDQIDATDFGLDDDAPGNKDKIAKAGKLFDAYFNDGMTRSDTEIKLLDELDKHSMALARYKSPA